MRYVLCLIMMAFLLGIHSFAFASEAFLGNMHNVKEAPIILMKQPAPRDLSWTANLKNNQVQSTVDLAPVVTRRSIERIIPTERNPILICDRPQVTRKAYIRTEAEIEIARNIKALSYGPNGIAGAPVPEPGSIAGLSAGLLGLAFQMRRLRKR